MKKWVSLCEYAEVVRRATVAVDISEDSDDFAAFDAARDVMERVGLNSSGNDIPEIIFLSDFSYIDNSSDYECEEVKDV